jgi:Papain family cysteine protease
MPIDIQQLRTEIQNRGFNWRVREVPATERHGLGFEPADPAKNRLALDVGEKLLVQIREAADHIARERVLADVPPAALRMRSTRISAAELIAHIKLNLFWFDWRRYPGVIGPVQDQGYCGSCVSFATTGLVGAQAAIELGISNLHLSEADQHFCSNHGANCFGWNNHDALDQIRTRGVVTDAVFPYMTAFDSPPQPDPASSIGLWKAYCHTSWWRPYQAYRIVNFTAHNGTDRQAYLRTVGPLVCGFTVYDDFFAYSGGVYKHTMGDVAGGHAVMVVGYSDYEQAWICRNSWGANWAGPAHADGTAGGFFKIGYGECNIDNEPFYGCTGVLTPPPFDIRRPIMREKQPPIPDPGPIRIDPQLRQGPHA